MAKAGNHLNDISKAIGAHAAKYRYGIVRDLVGHGIGTHLHEDPQIPNFPQKRRGIKLLPGMTLAVEPMINLGRADVAWLDDEWTVVTMDGSLSAHYENTFIFQAPYWRSGHGGSANRRLRVFRCRAFRLSRKPGGRASC